MSEKKRNLDHINELGWLAKALMRGESPKDMIHIEEKIEAVKWAIIEILSARGKAARAEYTAPPPTFDSLHCEDCPCWERSTQLEELPPLANERWGYCRWGPGIHVSRHNDYCYQGRLIMSGKEKP
jgi:hypothetical protein